MIIGRLKDMVRDREGNWIVSFMTKSDFSEAFDDLSGFDVSVDIKRYYRKRSLNANAFAWALIEQITNKLQVTEPRNGWTKESVYQGAIREIGGVSETVYVRNDAVQRFRDNWSRNGTGWQSEILEQKENGTILTLYYGSSVYDVSQMSQLINILIQEAESLGIPTMTEKEVEKLLGGWKKKQERRN